MLYMKLFSMLTVFDTDVKTWFDTDIKIRFDTDIKIRGLTFPNCGAILTVRKDIHMGV